MDIQKMLEEKLNTFNKDLFEFKELLNTYYSCLAKEEFADKTQEIMNTIMEITFAIAAVQENIEKVKRQIKLVEEAELAPTLVKKEYAAEDAEEFQNLFESTLPTTTESDHNQENTQHR